jgi:hypothetical protein
MVIGEKESVTITWRVDKPQLIALASELLIPTEERRDNFAKILSDGGEVTLILTSTVASGKK